MYKVVGPLLCSEKTHKTALNRNFILLLVCGLVLAILDSVAFAEGEIGLGIGIGCLVLLLIAAPVIGMPWCYRFDPEGVSAKYIFFPQERYLWKNIHLIHVTEAISDGGKSTLFFYDFKIEGNVEGKQRRYMDGRICKTRRTKRLIEKYWDGTIEGYWHDEVQTVKKWWNKRTRKGQNQKKQYQIDEIVLMEREARASVRKWIERFVAEARQYDLEVRTQYLYITEDYEEYRSRPQSPHTYTAVISICHPNETNEVRMIIFYTDLLRVRIGKKAYRGVVNLQAEDELKLSFSEIITEINQQGFDTYVKELNC